MNRPVGDMELSVCGHGRLIHSHGDREITGCLHLPGVVTNFIAAARSPETFLQNCVSNRLDILQLTPAYPLDTKGLNVIL
jgi:hypothetical protein